MESGSRRKARGAALAGFIFACGLSLTARVGLSIALKDAGDCEGADVVVNDDSGDLIACLIDDDKADIR
ncbi:hypothetical protein ESZ53_09835 [Salinibacterium sp. UTAS2018]|uniref:hypothetical protein n=1 Tax=Salinibacterium sp. UTAS2018 TaxID=2508880 RepID=UPI0010094495|nr:hypothetical protein [Salinibacterium sp. UTAS2018]QAV70707.1 hypothetical protein ESZ53_09835 [Salinibacterium sp. UTAS2018]